MPGWNKTLKDNNNKMTLYSRVNFSTPLVNIIFFRQFKISSEKHEESFNWCILLVVNGTMELCLQVMQLCCLESNANIDNVRMRC